MPKKILIITPRFPLPDTGACEKDRLEGIKQFKRLGFDVRVISKVFPFQDRGAIEKFSADFGIPVKLLEYENRFGIKKILNPIYWDGAAYEYSNRSTIKAVENVLDEWRPDLVWFDYTYLWPLYTLARRRKIPIITRSINFEPSHFLQEDGYSLPNLVKFLPKFASEIMAVHGSNFIFSITPKEEKIYRYLGAKNISNLPLRGLPECLKKRSILRDKEILNVIFMGSNYNVHHNRAALEDVLKKIAPMAHKKYPGRFRFYVSGRKIPPGLEKFFNDRVIGLGHKNQGEFDEFLADVDIAVAPSLFGAGMQQKIFEPFCRGIPSVASSRGVAGYPFVDKKHMLFADEPEEFVGSLGSLLDFSLRKNLAENAYNEAVRIFSQENLDRIILTALKTILFVS